mmetsp:Transcript_6295/g.12522  ORF Transcript_6295/g.12522 Transcript_6295/m.12522 type:complete len:906 (-) Transcript_6295:666-3383(-)
MEDYEGEWLASGSGDGSLRVWDLSTRKMKCQPKGHGHSVMKVASVGDGRRGISVGSEWGPKVCIWDVHGLSSHTLVKFPRGKVLGLHGFGYHNADERWQVATGASDGSVCVWDGESGACQQYMMGHRSGVTDIVSVERGRWLISSSYDGTLRTWNWAQRTCDRVRTGSNEAVHCLAVAKGRSCFFSGGQAEGIRLWDLRSPNCEGIISGEGTKWIWSMAAIDGGEQLISGGGDSLVWLWDLAMRKSIRGFKDHSSTILCVGWVKGRKEILSCSSDHTLKVWTTEGICKESLDHKGIVSSFAILEKEEISLATSSDTVDDPREPATSKRSDEEQNFDAFVPSEVETALVKVLLGKSQISHELLADVIQAKNIRTVADIFYGHNLVILALRCEILSRHACLTFNNVPFYFMKNLYHVFRNKAINDDERRAVELIAIDAERRGIIRNAYDVAQNMETNNYRIIIYKAFSNLQQRLLGIEHNLTQMNRKFELHDSHLKLMFASMQEWKSLIHNVNQRMNAFEYNQSLEAQKAKEIDRLQRRKNLIMLCARTLFSVIPFGSVLDLIADPVADRIISIAENRIEARFEEKRVIVVPLDRELQNAQKADEEMVVDLFNPRIMLGILKRETSNKNENEIMPGLESAIKDAGFDNMDSLLSRIEELMLTCDWGDELKGIKLGENFGLRANILNDLQEQAANWGRELNLRQVRVVLEQKAAFQENLDISTAEIVRFTSDIVDEDRPTVSKDLLPIIAAIFAIQCSRSKSEDPVELCLSLFDGLSEGSRSHYLISKLLKSLFECFDCVLDPDELSMIILEADSDGNNAIGREELIVITQVIADRHLRVREDFMNMTRRDLNGRITTAQARKLISTLWESRGVKFSMEELNDELSGTATKGSMDWEGFSRVARSRLA